MHTNNFAASMYPMATNTGRNSIAAAINASKHKVIWTTLFILVVSLALIVAYSQMRKKDEGGGSSGAAEKYNVGNVGGQSSFQGVQEMKHSKQLGCYSDMDCPDETRCTEQGLCIPVIHNLPRSSQMMKMGRGRADEKST